MFDNRKSKVHGSSQENSQKSGGAGCLVVAGEVVGKVLESRGNGRVEWRVEESGGVRLGGKMGDMYSTFKNVGEMTVFLALLTQTALDFSELRHASLFA
nr:hypothetical protein [Tanacetum cinerariifolium]